MSHHHHSHHRSHHDHQRNTPLATVGKVPGQLHEVEPGNQITIQALFAQIGLNSLEKCEIQRNGRSVQPTDEITLEPGDSVLAITKIRGNL